MTLLPLPPLPGRAKIAGKLGTIPMRLLLPFLAAVVLSASLP